MSQLSSHETRLPKKKNCLALSRVKLWPLEAAPHNPHNLQTATFDRTNDQTSLEASLKQAQDVYRSCTVEDGSRYRQGGTVQPLTAGIKGKLARSNQYMYKQHHTSFGVAATSFSLFHAGERNDIVLVLCTALCFTFLLLYPPVPFPFSSPFRCSSVVLKRAVWYSMHAV
ncbi:hypothetical protein BD289DRAFT_264921 [Coniella lustricola]|uniref:Uncharacterized protein n=1 Tax=Coniella lustricola TaxID=2025994 RepID=A0A2T3A7C8_9PEZI|nr:hypothetical protein BD289DRAFT_264921 [Coniella lustricola]